MPEWKLGDPVPEKRPEEVRERFGLKMRRAREGVGLSQRDAAEGAGCSQPVIGKLERTGLASEDVLVCLHVLYDLRISYPSAPFDPVRREEWFQAYRPKAPSPA